MNEPIRCEVLLFAMAAERAGRHRLDLELPAGSTLGDAVARIVELHPALAPHVPSFAVALDERYADLESHVRDGAVVAIIPPVSGG